MNKQILGIFVAILVVAISVMPISSVCAIMPIKITVQGSHFPVGPGEMEPIVAGESGNLLLKVKEWTDIFTGDINGIAKYSGNWLLKASGDSNIIGYWEFEEVTIAGIGTGSLRIGQNNLDLWIESGTCELSGIRGKGLATEIIPNIKYDVQFEIYYFP
jgi:hypothetical protein